MKDYQLRVIDEKADLDQKINKLTEFMRSPKFEEVGCEQRRLLLAQSMSMIGYSSILSERIDAFKRENGFIVKFKMRDGCEDLNPKKAHTTDAGYDLCAAENVLVPSQSVVLVPTGLYLELPFGFEAQIRSRSGLASKLGVFVLNSPGTIDSGFRDEVKVILF